MGKVFYHFAFLNWHYFGFTYGFSVGQLNIPLEKPEHELSDGEIISSGKASAAFIPSLGKA